MPKKIRKRVDASSAAAGSDVPMILEMPTQLGISVKSEQRLDHSRDLKKSELKREGVMQKVIGIQ